MKIDDCKCYFGRLRVEDAVIILQDTACYSHAVIDDARQVVRSEIARIDEQIMYWSTGDGDYQEMLNLLTLAKDKLAGMLEKSG